MNYKLFALIFPLTLSAHEADTLSVHKMDEIVVVSTPKEHTALRQQPLSSSSYGAGQLQEKGINNIKNLTAHVPSLFIPNYGSRLTSSIYLRGVGSRIGTPAIGMYVDDIPLANMSSMDQDLSDADRIDILRGPQGTLFGRNTIGGLIRVYTKNPFNYQGTDLMLSGASYNNYRARVTHYHRPSDKLAFSAGVSYEHLEASTRTWLLADKEWMRVMTLQLVGEASISTLKRFASTSPPATNGPSTAATRMLPSKVRMLERLPTTVPPATEGTSLPSE